MTRNGKPRLKWSKGDELNKWVTCISCGEEYFIESFELSPCCPICESRAYEESSEDFNGYYYGDSWGDLK